MKDNWCGMVHVEDQDDLAHFSECCILLFTSCWLDKRWRGSEVRVINFELLVRQWSAHHNGHLLMLILWNQYHLLQISICTFLYSDIYFSDDLLGKLQLIYVVLAMYIIDTTRAYVFLCLCLFFISLSLSHHRGVVLYSLLRTFFDFPLSLVVYHLMYHPCRKPSSLVQFLFWKHMFFPLGYHLYPKIILWQPSERLFPLKIEYRTVWFAWIKSRTLRPRAIINKSTNSLFTLSWGAVSLFY